MTSTTEHAPPESILAALDAIVRADGAMSGLQGRVAFGVESASGVAWWTVAFMHGAIETSLSHGDTPEAHATVILGDRRAAAMLGQPDAGTSERFTIRGHRPLVQRFIERYLQVKSPLATRLQHRIA